VLSGINIYTGQLRQPVYSFTFSGLTYNTLFEIPDELKITTLDPNSTTTSPAYVISNTSNYETATAQAGYNLQIDLSVGTAYFLGAVGRDGTTTSVPEPNVTAAIRKEYGVATLSLKTTRFYDQFLSDINILPNLYDAVAYSQIINKYGTHIASSVTIGGVAVVSADLQRCYAQQTGVQSTMNTAFQGVVNTGGSPLSYVSPQFASQATFSVAVSGGVPILECCPACHIGDLWVPTTSSYPIVIHTNLVDISTLTPVPAKKAFLQQAVAAYLRAYPVYTSVPTECHSTSITSTVFPGSVYIFLLVFMFLV